MDDLDILDLSLEEQAWPKPSPFTQYKQRRDGLSSQPFSLGERNYNGHLQSVTVLAAVAADRRPQGNSEFIPQISHGTSPHSGMKATVHQRRRNEKRNTWRALPRCDRCDRMSASVSGTSATPGESRFGPIGSPKHLHKRDLRLPAFSASGSRPLVNWVTLTGAGVGLLAPPPTRWGRARPPWNHYAFSLSPRSRKYRASSATLQALVKDRQSTVLKLARAGHGASTREAGATLISARTQASGSEFLSLKR